MSFVFDIAAAQQQSALGKYNQQVYNRNALVKEQEAEAIKKQTEFDIAKFDQQFEQQTVPVSYTHLTLPTIYSV